MTMTGQIIGPFVCMVVMLVVFAGFYRGMSQVPTLYRLGQLVAKFRRRDFDGNSQRKCDNPHCQSTNPVQANFCRRCGGVLNNQGAYNAFVAAVAPHPKPVAAKPQPPKPELIEV